MSSTSLSQVVVVVAPEQRGDLEEEEGLAVTAAPSSERAVGVALRLKVVSLSQRRPIPLLSEPVAREAHQRAMRERLGVTLLLLESSLLVEAGGKASMA